jgi:hypothetical protein
MVEGRKTPEANTQVGQDHDLTLAPASAFAIIRRQRGLKAEKEKSDIVDGLREARESALRS